MVWAGQVNDTWSLSCRIQESLLSLLAQIQTPRKAYQRNKLVYSTVDCLAIEWHPRMGLWLLTTYPTGSRLHYLLENRVSRPLLKHGTHQAHSCHPSKPKVSSQILHHMILEWFHSRFHLNLTLLLQLRLDHTIFANWSLLCSYETKGSLRNQN